MSTYTGAVDAQGVWHVTVDGVTLPSMAIFYDKMEDLSLTILADHFKDRVATNAYFSEFRLKYREARRELPRSKAQRSLKNRPSDADIRDRVADSLSTQATLTSHYYWEFMHVLARFGDNWTLTSEDIAEWISTQLHAW